MSVEQLPADLEALLAVEREAPAIAPEIQSRLFARLEKSIGSPLGPDDGGGPDGGGDAGGDLGGGDLGGGDLGALPDAGAGTAAQLASEAANQSGWLAALAAKPIALATGMFALGAASGAGVYSAVSKPDTPKAQIIYAQSEAPDAAPVAPPEPPAQISPEPAVPQPQPKATPKPERKPDKSMSPDERLAQERSILEVGRTALARGNPSGAITQFRKHARQHRRGKLSEERDALWIRALAERGDRAAAAKRATAFRKRYPRSLFTSMVNQAAGAP